MSTDPKLISEGWLEEHASLLKAYVGQPSADVLRRAMSLGRALFAGGVPPHDVAAAHMDSVQRLCEHCAADGCKPLRTARPLFVELMKVYGDGYEQQQELNRRLVRRTQQLRRAAGELRQSQGALRQSEENFRALAENARDAILIGTSDGRYVYANARAAALTGYSVEELVTTVRMEELIAPDEFDKVNERCRNRLASELAAEQYETAIVRKDGKRVPVEVTAARTLWQGEPAILGSLRDITERRRMEETLRKAHAELERRVEERTADLKVANRRLQAEIAERKQAEAELRAASLYARSLIEASLDPLMTISPAGKITDVNRAMETVTGVSRENLVGSDPVGCFTEPERVKEGVEQVLSKGAVTDYPLTICHTSGRTINVLYNATVYKNEAGEVQGVFAAARDVTERQRVEEALRASEDKYKLLVETAGQAIFTVDEQGVFLFSNTTAAQALGRKPEDIVGKTMWDLFPKALADRQMENITRVIQSGEAAIHEEQTILAGRQRWYETRIQRLPVADHGSGSALLIANDITKRKRAEEKLRDTTQLLQSIMDSATREMIVATDAAGGILSWNEGARRLLGYEPEEVVGKESVRIFHTEEYLKSGRIDLNIKNMMATGEPLEEELTYVAKDGGTLLAQQIVTPRFGEDGRFMGALGLARDVTERKRAEEKLRLFSQAVESSVEGIAMGSPDGKITYVNEAFARMFGYSREELIGEDIAFIHTEEQMPQLEQALRATMEGGWAGELSGKRKNGELFPLAISSSRVLDEKGNVIAHMASYRDISEHKRAAEALRESEARYRQLFATVSDAIMVFDGETTQFVDVNDATLRLYGYSKEEFLKLRHLDVTAEPEQSSASIEQTLAGKLSRIPVRYHRKKDGTIFPVEISASTFTLGNRRALCGVVRDITERQRAEEALRAERDHSKRIIDGTPAIVCGIAPDGTTTFVNPAGERITGYEAEELVGQNWWRVFYPDREYQQVEQLFRDFADGDVREYEMVLTTRTDEKRTISWNSINRFDKSGRLIEVIGFGNDVTKRKRAEEALQEQREILENLLAHIPHSVFWKDKNSIFLGCNRNFAREAGLRTPQDIVGQTDYELPWSKEQSDFYTQCDREVVSSGRPLYNIEEPCLRADGVEATLLTSKTPLRDLKGNILGVLGIYVDITDRKRIEATLRRQALVFENMHDGVIVIDTEERISDWNPGAERMFGYSKAAIMGKPPGVLNRPGESADVTRSIREGLQKNGRWAGQVNFVRADGSEGVCEVVSVPLCDPAGQVMGRVSVNRDITDRARAEEEVRRRQEELAHVMRLATMGEMAAGLAHELNQPLSAILYYARGCGRRLRAGGWDFDEVLGVTEKVAVQAERAGAFIGRLRAFVRKGRPRLAPVDLNLVVREAVGFAEHEARESGVTITFQLATPLRPVLADMIQIEQVILNLLRNGIEAMRETEPGRRRLTLQSSNAGSDAVMCAVRDTGCGFPEKAASQLFDAFYTTKPDGMGMGLPISRSIIESHGGRLWATPNPSGGAMFRFTLPVYREGQRHAD